MKAQRASAWLAVQSYKRKRAFASFAVRSNIRAFHESHVPVEIVRSLDASVEIGAGNGEAQISLADEAGEVEDQRGVAAIGVGSGGIRRGERALHRTGKEEMTGGAKGSCGCVRNTTLRPCCAAWAQTPSGSNKCVNNPGTFTSLGHDQRDGY